LKRWDSTRSIRRDQVYKKLSLGRKRELLMQIAATTFEDGTVFMHQEELALQIEKELRDLPPADVAEDIDGAVILRAIEAQHGLLIERAHRIYSFSHLTFQEYFTARSIAIHPSPEMFRQVVAHAADSRWREVLLLTASMLDKTNAAAFFVAFDTALREIIDADPKVCNLVEWIHRKAAGAAPPQQLVVRTYYIVTALIAIAIIQIADRGLDLVRARDLAHELASSFDPDRARARARAHTSEFTFNLFRALAHDRNLISASYLDLFRALALGPDLARTSDFARALVRTLTPVNTLMPNSIHTMVLNHAHDLILDLARAVLAHRNGYLKTDIVWTGILLWIQLVASSKATNRRNLAINELATTWSTAVAIAPTDLRTALLDLTLAARADQTGNWKRFERDVRAVLQAHLDIGHDWSLNESQLDRLSIYLEASLRLQECLDLAAVPDREAIRNHLLLPPDA
jgi:hypothetical protein